MKKSLLFLSLLLSLFFSYSQTYHSWDGKNNGISSDSKFHILNIFVNVIYDVHPDTNIVEDTVWPRDTNSLHEGVNVPGTIPCHLLDFMDTSYVCGHPHGCITRLFGESSFDTLQLTGDFIVVNVKESRVIQTYDTFFYKSIACTAIDVINDSGFSTLYGHDSIEYYDYYHENEFFFVQVIIRNISTLYGQLGVGSGHGDPGLDDKYITIHNIRYGFSGKGTLQCVGAGNWFMNPVGVVPHEISHTLFGDNSFHTSGGNHRGCSEPMPFMTVQGGYGLMGGGFSGLVGCNGYERWRMHWKHPASPYYIGARNAMNNGFVSSDISKEDGNQWFLLRDFVTYGDAVRIQLPYKDSTITPNQYIWLEFHNVGHNDKLDFLHYSNDSVCLYKGTPGIYAYYQIGRDTLESPNPRTVWDGYNRDNLRIISNEGYWDYLRQPLGCDSSFTCTEWLSDTVFFEPAFSNAFCGYQDQEKFLFPRENENDMENTLDFYGILPSPLGGSTQLYTHVIREFSCINKKRGDDIFHHSHPQIGDSLDAFSSHRKINMGTNPSTCNTKTCYAHENGYSHQGNIAGGKGLVFPSKYAKFNQSTTYLTGLSIEMMPLGDTLWAVMVRWDDYDIVDDARWTGKIVLKGSEQVNLTRDHSITLAQNRTPAQQFRDTESGYFAAPTKLTCEAGSHFTQQPHSTLLLTEKSRFVLDSAATYHLGDSAQILVQGGSTFTISKGADFTGGIASEIIVDSLSTLYVYDTARLRREARVIVRPGGKLIVNGGTLTNACDGEMCEKLKIEN